MTKTTMDFSGEIAVRLEDADARRVLHVAGPVDLANAAVLRQALLDALGAGAGGRSTVVDLAGVTAVDLAGLQLLCSAHRTFLARGADISLQGSSEWFRKVATAAGFAMCTLDCRRRPGDDCLWRETGECAG